MLKDAMNLEKEHHEKVYDIQKEYDQEEYIKT
jgi:hypothetical protein